MRRYPWGNVGKHNVLFPSEMAPPSAADTLRTDARVGPLWFDRVALLRKPRAI